MIEECKKEGSKPPEFTINKQGVAVKFFNILKAKEPVTPAFKKGLSETERKVLSSITKGLVSYSEICDDTGLSRSTVAISVSSLTEMNIISHVGSDKSGFWAVNKDILN